MWWRSSGENDWKETVLQRPSFIGMELPTLYVFKSANLVMHLKLPGLVSDAMKTYNNAKSKTLETKDNPKKKNK